MSKQARNSHKNAYAILGAEFLFILLPFIVSGIVFSYKGHYSKLLDMHEWSLAACVLIGQSLVKFISGMLANKDVYTARWERVAFAISFLIVAGLVPSLIILSLVLIDGVHSRGLAIAQVGIFVLAVVVFFAFGGGGEALMRIKHDPKD
jgi:ABC-type polysaccharide transport system permease subunit